MWRAHKQLDFYFVPENLLRAQNLKASGPKGGTKHKKIHWKFDLEAVRENFFNDKEKHSENYTSCSMGQEVFSEFIFFLLFFF